MKKKVTAMFIKAGWDKTAAEATVDRYWDQAGSRGCETTTAYYRVISQLAAWTRKV